MVQGTGCRGVVSEEREGWARGEEGRRMVQGTGCRGVVSEEREGWARGEERRGQLQSSVRAQGW